MVAGLFGLAVVPCAEAAQVTEAESVAHRLWDKLLTHCSSSYFYSGSVFDGSGMLSDVQVGHQAVIEYQGVRFRTVPIRVTDAERANGLSYRARISMIAHLYREGGEPWRDGPDMRPRNTDDIIAQAIGQANSDMFDMGGSGAMALELVKFKGTWAVARSSTTSSSALGFGSKFFDVEKVIAARVARYSCVSGTVALPPPTPAEANAQAAAAKKTADVERKAEDTRRAGEAKAQAERDQREELAKKAAESVAHEAQFSFSGTAAGFRQALAANLAKRAVELHLNPNGYAPALDAIGRLLDTCMTLSVRDWENAEASYRVDLKDSSAQAGRDLAAERARRVKNCDGIGGQQPNTSPSFRASALSMSAATATTMRADTASPSTVSAARM